MGLVAGYKLGKALCEVLGLPSKRIKSIRIEVEASKIAKAIIERYIDSDEVGGIVAVIENHTKPDCDDPLEREYRTVPMPDGPVSVMDKYTQQKNQ